MVTKNLWVIKATNLIRGISDIETNFLFLNYDEAQKKIACLKSMDDDLNPENDPYNNDEFIKGWSYTIGNKMVRID